jgi:hypothetical protein
MLLFGLIGDSTIQMPATIEQTVSLPKPKLHHHIRQCSYKL